MVGPELSVVSRCDRRVPSPTSHRNRTTKSSQSFNVSGVAIIGSNWVVQIILWRDRATRWIPGECSLRRYRANHGFDQNSRRTRLYGPRMQRLHCGSVAVRSDGGCAVETRKALGLVATRTLMLDRCVHVVSWHMWVPISTARLLDLNSEN